MTSENFLQAWRLFSRGKLRQPAVHKFWLNLENELTALYHDFTHDAYVHGPYTHFTVNDTKKRDIYVARVRDRVVHQLVSSYLEERYKSHFIAHSFAAQKGKGVSAAREYIFGVMRGVRARGDVWIGKMDVKKYFANIDHQILLSLLGRRITDEKIMGLCWKIIQSFAKDGRGLPLGNLTSQWFGNIYLHELDWYAKQILRIPCYARYNDDVIVVGGAEARIRNWMDAIVQFVTTHLKLTIPPSKTSLVRLPMPVDVLGVCTDGVRTWIRPATERRAHDHLAVQYSRLAPTFLDGVCSYCGIRVYSRYEFI